LASFEKVDINPKDKSISYDEWSKGYKALIDNKANDKFLKEVFEVADKDKNKGLTLEEFKVALAEAKKKAKSAGGVLKDPI